MEVLKDVHTKVLLGYLDGARKCGGFWSPYDNNVGWTTTQLKEELDKREHVPNKTEAKALRQAAAKKGR